MRWSRPTRSPPSRAATTSSWVAAPSPAPSSARRSPRTSGARSCSRSRCCSCFHCCSSAGGRRCCHSSSGITTVLGTFLVLSVVNLAYGLNVFALNLVIGLGLGLAIDYTLFLVTRFREELANGAEPQAAVVTTMNTAGKHDRLLRRHRRRRARDADAVPARLRAVHGPRRRERRHRRRHRLAARLARPARALGPQARPQAVRRAATTAGTASRTPSCAGPGVIAVATAAVMLAVALPALTVNWTPVGADAVPAGQSARVLSDASEREFGGAATTPVTMAVTAPESAAGAGGDVRRPLRRAGAVPRLEHLGPERRSPPATPWRQQARALVDEVRADGGTVPGPGDRPGGRVHRPAGHDRRPAAARAGRCSPALTFVLLWLMTGSIVLPLKAIVMNALTVGAALAPLVLIYQHGRLAGCSATRPTVASSRPTSSWPR